MSRLDWFVLFAALISVVLWGLWKGRGATTGEGYIGFFIKCTSRINNPPATDQHSLGCVHISLFNQ